MIHVKVENLCKSFGERHVVEDVSFEVRAGYVLGILGDENTGKTTVLRMLLDVIKPDSGSIAFDERVINQKVKDTTGYLPQNRGLLPDLRLNELLIYSARLKNMSRKKAQVEAVRLMDRFQLIDHMDTQVRFLSETTRRNVPLMQAIIHNPELLVLDEPFANQPVEFIKLIRKLVQRFRDEGKTVVLATRDIDEAELLCDEVLVLRNGRAAVQGNLAELRNRTKENIIDVTAVENLEALQSIYGVKRVVLDDHSAQLFVDKRVPPQKILDLIVKTVNVTRIEVNRPGLRDIIKQAK